jgi:hypothetical protein
MSGMVSQAMARMRRAVGTRSGAKADHRGGSVTKAVEDAKGMMEEVGDKAGDVGKKVVEKVKDALS